MASTHIRIPEKKKKELDDLKKKLRKETGEDVSTSDIFENVEMDDLEEMVKKEEKKMRNTRSLFD